MNIIDSMQARKSVRTFLDKKIPDNTLTSILTTTRFAPSAFNRQEWRLIIVKDPKKSNN
ncbi:MAG: nitroreductase family protein [Candidatus Bathyarchaeota archaeon]